VEKPDFESTTQVLARRAPGLAWLLPFRKYLTPATLWGAVVALSVAIWYVVAAQHDLHSAQADIRRHDESIAALQRQGDILNEIKTQVAVMNGKMDSIAAEVDRQREWRERIEDVAEAPPHARRRK
jgi:hypothetical protein